MPFAMIETPETPIVGNPLACRWKLTFETIHKGKIQPPAAVELEFKTPRDRIEAERTARRAVKGQHIRRFLCAETLD